MPKNRHTDIHFVIIDSIAAFWRGRWRGLLVSPYIRIPSNPAETCFLRL
jgi:hypothetical protein